VKLSEMSTIFEVAIDPIDRMELLAIIRREVRFLAVNNIMDYSVLLGIEQVKLAQYHEKQSATDSSSKPLVMEKRLV
jgi:hypothetical protein